MELTIYRSHSSYVHCTARVPAIPNLVRSRFINFFSRNQLSLSPIVVSVFRQASLLAYTFLGYNNFLRFYSSFDFIISSYIRSVRLFYGASSPFEQDIYNLCCVEPLYFLSFCLLLFHFSCDCVCGPEVGPGARKSSVGDGI